MRVMFITEDMLVEKIIENVVVYCTFDLAPVEHQLQEGYRDFDPE